MSNLNPKIDQYLIDGCGRCDYYKTPQCKVHKWTKELKELRRIALECGLTEEYKWSAPCYTFNNKNVLMVSALKKYATMAFFKGVLLKDKEGILVAPGKSSQSSRQARFTKVKDIIELEPVLKAYIAMAIQLEKDGSRVQFKENPEAMPEELIQKLAGDPQLKAAFESLTPGRQRGYILHFSQPKQSKTRFARIEKWKPTILKGEGMHDSYRSKKK